MKNGIKKGFTLVELMTVIFVLGIIAMIIGVSVDKTIKNNKEKLYQTQISNIESAARAWGTKNIGYLPVEDGEVISIPLLILKQEGIVDDDLKNPKNDKLFNNNMYIDIIYDNGNYNYNIVEESIVSNGLDQTDLNYPAIIFKEKWKLGSYYAVFDGWVILSDKSVVASPEVTINNDKENKVSVLSFNEDVKEFVVTRKVDFGCIIINDQNNNGTADFGDQISCGTEKFYVMTNDGSNIEMLAKYRINLDSKIQNKGQESTENILNFSSTTYWYDENGNIKSDYPLGTSGTYYYIYDELEAKNASADDVIYYIYKYEENLKSMGFVDSEAKLMSFEQALSLGCYYDIGGTNGSGTCGPSLENGKIPGLETPAPKWVWDSTYWLGSHGKVISQIDRIWSVDIDGSFDRPAYQEIDYFHGARPVVSIPTSYLVSN